MPWLFQVAFKWTLYYLAAGCEAAEAALAEEAAAGAGADAVAATGLTAPFGWDLPHT